MKISAIGKHQINSLYEIHIKFIIIDLYTYISGQIHSIKIVNNVISKIVGMCMSKLVNNGIDVSSQWADIHSRANWIMTGSVLMYEIQFTYHLSRDSIGNHL